jgi:hypothetical protein
MNDEHLAELYAALAKVQEEMQNPAFDGMNPHFKSRYASLASVRNAVIPVFAKHGIAVIQDLRQDAGGVSCLTILLHSSGGRLDVGPLTLPASKADAQGFGSACTYARRYTLQAVAGVVGDEDDDGNAAPKRPEPQKKPERPALPPYPDGNMAANLPEWRRHSLAGKNPADIISMIATKYALTDEQKRQIMALKPDTETGEIGDPMKVTFAQLAGRFAKAKDIDMLDADADLIQHVEDAAQRGELKDMHKKRRAELEGGE